VSAMESLLRGMLAKQLVSVFPGGES
jgi:hypothetical protein